MELERGSLVDRYVVDSVLGAGAMAAVYRIRHEKLGTDFALKVLTLTSKAVEQRLLREGRVQASLRHPNVVAVVDVLEIGGRTGLVMEYVDGPSLDDLLQRRSLDVPTTVLLAYGIVSGVKAAHDAGFVHRDLKPANVLLKVEGDTVVPKVADFGLAKVLAGDDGIAATRSGMTMGSPSYMAPEQIRDAKNVDRRADVFALGCLLYEMVTGRRTFAGDDVLQVFVKIADGDYPRLAEVAPDLPAPLVRAIEGALARDVTQRLPDCDALLALLREAVGADRDPRTVFPMSAEVVEAVRTHGRRVRAMDPADGGTATWAEAPAGSASGPGDAPGEEPAVSSQVSLAPQVLPGPTLAPPATVPPAVAPTAPARSTAREGGGMGRWAALLAGGGLLAAAVGAVAVVALAVGGWFAWSQVAVRPAEVPQPTSAAAPDAPPIPDAPVAVAADGATVPGPAVADAGAGPETTPVPVPAEGAAPPAVDCANPGLLETRAAEGSLTSAERSCLAARMVDPRLPQVDRDKLGRVLLRDAKVRCDGGRGCADYETHQRAFFQAVSRSDAELMYAWTSHLARTAADDAARKEVLQWVGYTLERKDQWGVQQHIDRVERLLEIRARTAYARFQADPSLATAAEDAALEWTNNRLALGRDASEGLTLCASVTGSEASCRKQVDDQKATILVTVASFPPGATVKVDGADAGQTPKVLELAYGDHALELVAGEKVARRTIPVGVKEPTSWMWRVSDDTWTEKR